MKHMSLSQWGRWGDEEQSSAAPIDAELFPHAAQPIGAPGVRGE